MTKKKPIGKVRKPYGPGAAGSIRELAEKVGRNYKTVREWMQRDDWPFSKTGPWKLKDVRIWMDSYLDHDATQAYEERLQNMRKNPGASSGATSLTRARVEGTIERTLLTRQRRLVEKGKLISNENAQAIRLRQIHAVKSALLSLPRSIANAITGKSKRQVEKVVLERVEEIIRSFAEGGG